MGKRSNFERRPRDLWPTPAAAVAPLLPHLSPRTRFIEPCCGAGRLAVELEAHGHRCTDAFDMLAQGYGHCQNCFDWHRAPRVLYAAATIITNPPWTRELLHPMILHFASQHPTVMLFDADWVHTRQAAPYLPMLTKIVSVGRVKWIEDSPSVGKDNAAWHFFDARNRAPALFYGRAA